MSNLKELVEIVNDVDSAIANLLEKHQMSVLELGSIFTARFVRLAQEVGDGDFDEIIPEGLFRGRGLGSGPGTGSGIALLGSVPW